MQIKLLFVVVQDYIHINVYISIIRTAILIEKTAISSNTQLSGHRIVAEYYQLFGQLFQHVDAVRCMWCPVASTVYA